MNKIFKSTENDDIFKIIAAHYKASSKTKIRNLIKHGCVSVQGTTIKRTDHTVRTGDMIEVSDEWSKFPRRYQTPYKIIFEDKHLIAVLKPAGLVTSGDVPDRASTLHKNLNHYLNSVLKNRITLFVIHRIDKEVEGIVLFAKSEYVQLKIKENWNNVEKKYYALVNGTPPHEQGIISSWLHEGGKQKVYSAPESSGSKYAITQYKVLKKLTEYTLLELGLETGRKNQIRVHMSDIGCPIVGDWKYGDKSKIRRQIRLIAFFISFIHPVSGKKIKLEVPLPKKFLKLGDMDEKYK
jgi:23S rRNA pseudouridine1911/1915/1917 synthase